MLLANDVLTVFWIAIIPGVIAVVIPWFAVKEPAYCTPAQTSGGAASEGSAKDCC